MNQTFPESRVVDILGQNASKLVSKGDSWFQLRELDAGYGVADIVFLNLDRKKLKKRITEKPKAILSKQVIKTILAFKQVGEPLSVSYLSKELGTSESYIKNNILKFLKENGYIEQIDGNFELTFDYELVTSNSIAIEAKISDWKRGLYQANRYKWFSEQSYLALLERNIKPALKNIDLFRKLNVGLISVNENSCKVLYEPFSEKPKSLDKQFFANEQIISSHSKRLLPI